MPNTVLVCGANETDCGRFAVWVESVYPGHTLSLRIMGSVTDMVTGVAAGEFPSAIAVLVAGRPGKLDRDLIHQLNVLKLLGTDSVVLAVIGLQPDDRHFFAQLESDFADAASRIGITEASAVGFGSNLEAGDNEALDLYDWSSGISFFDLLAPLPTKGHGKQAPFRFSVQGVDETDNGTCVGGLHLCGSVTVDQEVAVSPADRKTQVLAIETGRVDDTTPGANTVSTLTVSPGSAINPGDLIGSVLNAPEHTDQFAAHVLWLDETPLLPERQYTIRANAFETTAQVTDLKHKLNFDTSEHVAAKTLASGEIGLCNFSLDRDLAFDEFDKNPATGSFILLDKVSGEIAGFGVIRFGLRRATNLSWQETKLDKAARAQLKGQNPCVLWFTGLSGAGKSAAADRIEQKLKSFGHHTYLLDGDNVRHGLNRDLGFTDQDRVENIRRVAEVSRLMADAGLIVLVSFISPFRSERRMARDLMDDGEFIEVFMDTPLDICESRDPKGLYQKARAGQIKNFTGIDSDYERPERAELTLQSHHHDVDTLADQVIEHLQKTGKI